MKSATFLIFFNTTWDWPADYCRQTAECVSKTNFTFCYLGVEPVSFFPLVFQKQKMWEKVHPRLWRYKPITFPLRRFFWIAALQQWFNIRLFQLFVYRVSSTEQSVIAWIFDQMYGPILRFFPQSWKILYDCVDYVWDPDPEILQHIQEQENILIAKVKWMVVNSQTLRILHQDKRNDIAVVPLGFRHPDAVVRPQYIQGRKNPTIGLVGVLDYRIDYQLIMKLADRHPDWQFVLQGKLSLDYDKQYHISDWIARLKQMQNVSINPSTSREKVYTSILQFDICMIPYRTDIPFNRYCYPMKLFEYFYAGKPVVSTPIEELKRYKTHLRIGITAREWEGHIHHFLLHPLSSSYKTEQRMLAQQNSWEQKISSVLRFIGR